LGRADDPSRQVERGHGCGAEQGSDAARTAALVVTLLAVVLAVLVASRDQRQVLYDAAAITFRFAEQIAHVSASPTTMATEPRERAHRCIRCSSLLGRRWRGCVALASWRGVACCGATVGVDVLA
jgi:hypothetical protein